MLINEVCDITTLTKKAISYYEQQGLIKPKKGSNGYREYTDVEIKLLNEISLYRKLDISIKDIKILIESKDKKELINNIIEEKNKKEMMLKIQKIYLNRVVDNNFSINSMVELNKEISEIEKNNGEFIKKELIRAFPSGIGKYLAYHFAPYLNEPLNTVDKYNAWLEIVKFLDEVPEIKIPKIIEFGYNNMSEDMHKQINENTKNEINKMLNAKGEELEIHKERILKSIEKQNDKSFLEIINPINKFKKQLNEFFNSSGYYNIFIPNMKILSNEYSVYHEKLTELNIFMCNELGIKYDENMRIIRI